MGKCAVDVKFFYLFSGLLFSIGVTGLAVHLGSSLQMNQYTLPLTILVLKLE